MREVSCRPVRSDEEMLTGAPRCSLMLTFRSLSTPDTGRGDVLAAGAGDGDREAGRAAVRHRVAGVGACTVRPSAAEAFRAPTGCLRPATRPAPEGRAHEAPRNTRHVFLWAGAREAPGAHVS